MTQGIIFDFGNVISAFDTGIFIGALASRTETTPRELEALVYGSGLHRLYEAGEISSRRFYKAVAEGCALRMDEETFARAFVDIFTPIESTRDLIRGLAGRYRLGLLSNTNEWHFDRYIRETDVFPLFDSVTLSYEVKALKPSEAIYRDALEKLALSPDSCIFVDDVESYVDGARRLGVRGIRYAGPERLRADLERAGVKIGG